MKILDYKDVKGVKMLLKSKNSARINIDVKLETLEATENLSKDMYFEEKSVIKKLPTRIADSNNKITELCLDKEIDIKKSRH